MSEGLLSASVRPGDLTDGRKGRHLGKLPVILAVTVFMVLLGAMLYGGYVRTNNVEEKGEVEKTPTRALAGNEFDEFLNQQDDGYINPEEPQQNEQSGSLGSESENSSSQLNQASSERGEKELTEVEKLYVDYEKKQIEDYLRAIGSQTETSSASLTRIEQESSGGLNAEANDALSAYMASGGSAIDANSLISERLSALAGASGGGTEDFNKQNSKIAFLNQTPSGQQYLPSSRTDQITEYELKAGTVIPGVMISGINSDLPGQIIAQVRDDVYDTATGQHLLVPQGSRLYGTYDSQVSYGQNRSLTVWTRLIYPDGSTQDLGAMGGSDQAGYSGFKDKVNNHMLRTFGSIFMLSVFNALPELVDDNQQSSNANSQSNSQSTQITEVIPVTEQQFVGFDEDDEPIIIEVTRDEIVTRTVSSTDADSSDQSTGGGSEAFSDEFKAQLAQTTAQVATEITRKNLNIQPTITIRPGYKFNVMVNKDIAFKKPYRSYR